MPANLSPEYKAAQEAFRKARDPQERLEHLREMLKTIPKHKGTEHLQAEIKTRIKELTEETTQGKRGGARGGPALFVRPEGAAQVVLLGPPNSGKSSLHVRLTSSHSAVLPSPYTTQFPVPGMLPHEDIHFQLVDLPPISAESVESWMFGAIEHADGALLVVDLEDPDCVEHVQAICRHLERRRIALLAGATPSAGADAEDPFGAHLPTVLLVNKTDRLADPASELAAFMELTGLQFPSIGVSAETGLGLSEIGSRLFTMLEIVRAFTKVPGHPVDRDRPYTLRGRATVRDVARLVHRGLSSELKFARLWGSADFPGQQVSADHPVHDRDVVELHW